MTRASVYACMTNYYAIIQLSCGYTVDVGLYVQLPMILKAKVIRMDNSGKPQ